MSKLSKEVGLQTVMNIFNGEFGNHFTVCLHFRIQKNYLIIWLIVFTAPVDFFLAMLPCSQISGINLNLYKPIWLTAKTIINKVVWNQNIPLRGTECVWMSSRLRPHLKYALYSVDSSQQVQASTENTEHTGHDAWESYWLQHLCGSWKRERTQCYRLSTICLDKWTTKALTKTYLLYNI